MDEEVIEILRQAMRASGSMQRWISWLESQRHENPGRGARDMAFEALRRFESKLTLIDQEPHLREAGRIAREVLLEINRENSPKTPSRKKNNFVKTGKARKSYRSGRRKPAADSRATGAPYRRGDEENKAIPSATPDPKQDDALITARKDTPAYARLIDEGIGGTREQVMSERGKLRRESRFRRD